MLTKNIMLTKQKVVVKFLIMIIIIVINLSFFGCSSKNYNINKYNYSNNLKKINNKKYIVEIYK